MKCAGIVILGLLIGPQLAAQTPSRLEGTWRACFELTAPTHGAPPQVCGTVTLPSGSACGGSIVRWTVPIDSLQGPLPYNGGDVRLELTATGLGFGGRVQDLPPKSDGTARCAISSDDGSLYGQGTLQQDTVTGTWGISGFTNTGPLGRFTLTRL